MYDVGESEGVLFLTMPFIRGEPLSDLVADGPIDPGRAVAIVRTIALAMAEAHAKNVVHRDLKPSNILMCPRRGPVVIDFGLSRRQGPEESRLTHNGVVMGDAGLYGPPADASATRGRLARRPTSTPWASCSTSC